MPIPLTGTTWDGGGYSAVDSRFNTRGGLAAVMIRDNRGSATNISPWQAGAPPTRLFSPFAQDGKPRSDLFAVIRVNGEWVTNPVSNEGFWLIGALTEDGGPEKAPNITEDNQMILQSNFPFDTDLTEEGITINFTGVETLKPLMKRLRMNLPLSDESGNPIVEDPGMEDFSIGKTVDVESPERQIILMFARRKQGRYMYTAEGYSLCKLTNIGNFRRSKTDPDAGELGFTVLPDPYFMSKDPKNPTSTELVPILYNEWTSGQAWTAIGGLPVWGVVPPVLTPGAATTGTVAVANPTGAGDPFTVTAEKSLTPFSTWSAATISTVAPNTPTAGSTTYSLTGLSPGSVKVRLTAEGTNGQTALSPLSNAATII